MRQTININENWLFIKDHSQPIDTIPEQAESIQLPHTWNAIDGQDGGNDYFRGTCCYMKQLVKDTLPSADCYYLEICGANSSADVYLDDKHVAHHDGGYSTWRVNITEYINAKTISIFVDNAPNNTVYPQSADFTFYGGLYRDVNIIAVSDTHFDLDYFGGTGLQVTPKIEGNNASVNIKTYITNLHENDNVVLQILDANGNVIALSNNTDTADLSIPNVHLWHGKKDPYLYTAQALIERDGKIIDQVTTTFGCRTFEIDPERGFILNGEEYPLRGVSRHQDRWGIGNALLPEHHLEDIDFICEVGANTIRLAHYQHDQYFYDLCDERGLVIWAEIPYISYHMADGRENTIQQMKELIVQNYNHPSIIVWGLSNEISMGTANDPDLIENHRILNDLAHEMDPTRLTTIACVTMCGIDEEYVHIPDTVAYNHYFGWYGGDTSMYGPWFDKFHEKYPRHPIGVSEYGCEALNWHTSRPVAGDYTEEYQAKYHEDLIRQLFPRKYIWATYVWNMFDFGADSRNEGGENGQNHKGLMTFDRNYKKDSFYAYKAWLSDEPFVHICGKRYIDRVEDVTKVTVYSNLPEVELFVNGTSLEKKSVEDHFFYFEVPNIGESTLVAVSGECKDESSLRKVDTFNEEYRYKEQGTVLNWFDITEPEGYYSLNDKISDIIKPISGKLWFAGFVIKLLKKISAANKNAEKTGKEKTDISVNKDNAGYMLDMVGAISILRLTSLISMIGVCFTKEELLQVNKELNNIKKKL